MYLFDTNGISEALRPRPNPEFVSWIGSLAPEQQFTSIVVSTIEVRKQLGEILDSVALRVISHDQFIIERKGKPLAAVVTGDRHLLDLVEVQGVRLIKPRAFIDKPDDDRM